MKKYKYIVRYGFDQLSRVSIEAGGDLERVIYAKMKQQPVEVQGRIFDGKHIIDIRPDIHYYTGWFPHYEPKEADDWKQIERDVPKEIDQVLSEYTNHVRILIDNNQTGNIGKNLLQLNVDKLQIADKDGLQSIQQSIANCGN